jgi:dTMP kinase
VNRLDEESPAFHERVRLRYLELAAAEPGRFVIVDASQPPDRIEEDVWAVLEGRLRRLGSASGH